MAASGAETYSVSYGYDGNNRLESEEKTEGALLHTTAYGYDANGNQTHWAKSTLTPAGQDPEEVSFGTGYAALYEYDAFNQMTSAYANGELTEYAYRVDGLRWSKSTAAGPVAHVWDGSSIVADLDGGGAVVASYVRGTNLLRANASTGAAYYLYNGHGDVTGLTDGSGALTWEYDFDAFGNEREIARHDTSTDTNPFRYTGEYFDTESGTYYLRARYMNPMIGRFLSEDPIHSGLNWYTYCGNNPIIFIDPFGLAEVIARSYAEYFGANVEWTGNKTVDGACYASATVTFNGNLLDITGKIVNERLMIDDSVLNSNFGWSNPYIPNGETHAVHIGTHTVDGTKGLASHSSIIIFAGYDSDLLKEYSDQFINNHMGMLYTTIGAGQSNPDGKPNFLSADYNPIFCSFIHPFGLLYLDFDKIKVRISATLNLSVFQCLHGDKRI
ncbi:MAG: RHS repeat-associated core domain-containing protein [Peptococcaceae bacterium]|jgi:RHS repeat-associated protein|nr:RHS repeat-associated core domain-containing protein [Peptococcaceae bacterium]